MKYSEKLLQSYKEKIPAIRIRKVNRNWKVKRDFKNLGL